MVSTLERFQEVLKPIVNVETTLLTSVWALHLDPLDLVQLIIDIEEEFDIVISDEDAEKFKTVGDIIKYIDKKGKKK